MPRRHLQRALRRAVALVLLAPLAVASLLGLGIEAAEAHPHVFVTAKEQVIFGPDGKVTGIRAAWTFDDMYSSFVTQGIGAPDQILTPQQLAPLAQTNVDSLQEFGYFTIAKANGHQLEFQPPTDYSLEENKDKLVTLFFTLPLKSPVRASPAITVSVYDPTYFVSFEMDDKAPVSLAVGAVRMFVERHQASAARFRRQPEAVGSLFRQHVSGRRFRHQAREQSHGRLPLSRRSLLPAGVARAGVRLPGRGGTRPGPGQEPVQRRHLGRRRQHHRHHGLDPGPAGLLRTIARRRRPGQSHRRIGLWWLGGLSFVYGVLHAAGPGHGKAVLASYMVANERALRRGIVLSFLAALLQAAVAVALVGLLSLVFHATAIGMRNGAAVIEKISYLGVALLGFWLVWRKATGLMAAWRSIASNAPMRDAGVFASNGRLRPVGLARPAGLPLQDWNSRAGRVAFGSARTSGPGRLHRHGSPASRPTGVPDGSRFTNTARIAGITTRRIPRRSGTGSPGASPCRPSWRRERGPVRVRSWCWSSPSRKASSSPASRPRS